MTGDGIRAALSPGEAIISAEQVRELALAAAARRMEREADDYVCPWCERNHCYRCTERACTCCSGVPDDDAA